MLLAYKISVYLEGFLLVVFLIACIFDIVYRRNFKARIARAIPECCMCVLQIPQIVMEIGFERPVGYVLSTILFFIWAVNFVISVYLARQYKKAEEQRNMERLEKLLDK